MGCKAFKAHYRIGHHVHLTSQGLCIGSPYIHNLIVVEPSSGIITKAKEFRQNEDLQRYMTEIRADPAKALALIQQPDEFTASLPVWTYHYDTAAIIEQQCESYGWPNITHDGQLMYENTHFPTRDEAVQYLASNLRAGIELDGRRIAELETDLAECKQRLATHLTHFTRVHAENPHLTFEA